MRTTCPTARTICPPRRARAWRHRAPTAIFVSVFAFCGPARGVSEQGLKYTLDNADLPDTTSWGLSNEFTGADAAISVADGVLAVTFPLEAWPALER